MKRLRLCVTIFILFCCIFSMLFSCTDNSNTSDYVSDNIDFSIITEDDLPATNDKLNVGYTSFTGEFNPFYAETTEDSDVVDMTSVSLLTFDDSGNIVFNAIEGENAIIDGNEYCYNGIADIKSSIDLNGIAIYDITLREDIKFSDGAVLNADDVIFSMYVLSDPEYEGPVQFYTLPIIGMDKYRTTKVHLYERIIYDVYISKNDNYTGDLYTQEQADYCVKMFDSAGYKFTQAIVDYSILNFSDYGVYNVSTAAALRGYDLTENATVSDFWKAILTRYGSNIGFFDGISSEFTEVSFIDIFSNELEVRKDEFYSTVAAANNHKYIEGIEKIDEFSLRITMAEESNDVYSKLSIAVAPLHYYGDEALYDYENNMFGFNKGDLSSIKDNNAPIGAGPYILKSYKEGTVSFERNTSFFKGVPNVEYVNFIEMPEDEKSEGVLNGYIDIAAVTLSSDESEKIKYANSGELSGDVVTVYNYQQYGYGYIGINAEKVKVGDDKSSSESKALRKAFATVFSVYREPVINEYFGSDALINYPIHNNSWAAPTVYDNNYTVAFSKDVNGNDIYDNTKSEEKYEKALWCAVAFLKQAGYIYDDSADKFISAPNGASLDYRVVIIEEGDEKHPALDILSYSKSAFARVGINLQIIKTTDQDEFWKAVTSNECHMWAAAWDFDFSTPSLFQRYHSDSKNIYGVDDARINAIIENVTLCNDPIFAKSLYKECFDKVMEWAVEIPLYQKQNVLIVSNSRVDLESIPKTVFTNNWIDNIHKIKTK